MRFDVLMTLLTLLLLLAMALTLLFGKEHGRHGYGRQGHGSNGPTWGSTASYGPPWRIGRPF